MPPLGNARQERFVQELLKGRAAKEAYRLAGYKPHQGDAYRLQRHPAVIRRYEELAGAAARLAGVTAAQVIEELAAIAFANIADYMTVDADGRPRPDLARLTRDRASAVVEISANAHRVRIRLADKLAALSDLARMLGLFRHRVEIAPMDRAAPRAASDVEIARRIAFMLAQAEAATPKADDGIASKGKSRGRSSHEAREHRRDDGEESVATERAARRETGASRKHPPQPGEARRRTR